MHVKKNFKIKQCILSLTSRHLHSATPLQKFDPFTQPDPSAQANSDFPHTTSASNCEKLNNLGIHFTCGIGSNSLFRHA